MASTVEEKGTAPLRIVLTGGLGFVGQAVLRQLGRMPKGSAKVRLLIRRSELPEQLQALDFIECVRGELPQVPTGLGFNEPFVVLHFATKQIDKDGSGYTVSNVLGTKALLENLAPKALGFIYGSSMSVYGSGAQDMVSEDDALLVEGATELAQSRLAAEELILAKMRAWGKDGYVLRPRFILGEGDKFTLPAFVKMFRLGVRIGNGEQRFSVIDVDDYAAVIVKLAIKIAQKPPGNPQRVMPLNVGYCQPISFNRIGDILAGELARKHALRLSIPLGLYRFCGRFRSRLAQKIQNQLALVGLEHSADISRLAAEVDDELLLGKDPGHAVLKALTWYRKANSVLEQTR